MNATTVRNKELRTLTSSLGWTEDDVYVTSPDCLKNVETLESLLAEEDIFARNVRLFICCTQLVEKDLIPILIHSNESKIHFAVVRLLVNLTLPVECLLPHSSAGLPTDVSNIVSQLHSFLLTSATAFLHMASTSLIVNTLRDEMLKSERFQVPLNETKCEHLKNCLLLLRNILHCPATKDQAGPGTTKDTFADWEAVQSKLVWNLFVQGLDGALLLMLNSKHKSQWTVPMAQIITLLYKNQSISRVQHSLELISSTSESAEDDEESDGSKNSSTSLSSEPQKNPNSLTDSGCPQSSDDFSNNISTDEVLRNSEERHIGEGNESYEVKEEEDEEGYDSEIDVKFKTFSIQDTDEDISMESASDYSSSCEGMKVCSSDTSEYKSQITAGKASPSSCNSRKEKTSDCAEDANTEEVVEPGASHLVLVSKCAKPETSSDKQSSSDNNAKNVKLVQRNTKVPHKHRNSHIHDDIEESDSSINTKRNSKAKPRIHPLVAWKGKAVSSKRTLGCAPSICLDTAFAIQNPKTRFKFPLWEKRNSVSALLDKNSNAPTEEEIGNLLKDFTLCFLHSGFKNLILDLRVLLMRNMPLDVDKSHFFWLLSYFMHFGKTSSLNLRHVSDILSLDMISYLTYEGVLSCEEIEMHIVSSRPVPSLLISRPHLLVAALKEIIATIYAYSGKASNQKDKEFFNKLCCGIAEVHELRQLPLLLLHSYHSLYHTKQYLQDIVIFNHYLLLLIEKGSDDCWQPKRINLYTHLKQFACQTIVQNYGRVLEDFKTNSFFVNDCVFTMMHHLAGDINAPQLLMQPTILKTFSSILREEMELQQYWEDLIMYILNKFSAQVEKRNFELKNAQGESDDSCSWHFCVGQVKNERSSMNSSSVSSNSVFLEEEDDDELFWWYLQFELYKDPISRISEHVSAPKDEILWKLHSKGIITKEKYEEFKKLESETSQETSENINAEEIESYANSDDEITHILRKLVQSGHHHHITWLQDQLLETCFVKIGSPNHYPEPIPLCSCQMLQNVPIVPYTDDQKAILQDETFILLLRKLGFYLGSDLGKLYPRIPVFWTAEMLHCVAARLGPIRNEKLKYRMQELSHSELAENSSNHNVKQEENLTPKPINTG